MSLGLSAAELAQMRSDINQLLPDTGYILALTRTSDGGGGWSESWGTAGTAVCRLDFPNPGKEQSAADRLQSFKSGVLNVPYDTTITTANRLSLNSHLYNIVGVNIDQSWIPVKQCLVEAINA